MSIFREIAPRFWDAGLPAIPLGFRQKKPALNAWTAFCRRMPSEMEQEMWLQSYANNNVGLPGGPQSGLVFLDVDTDDPKVNAIIDALVPHSPWKRIGRKGSVRAFRYAGHQTFQIKEAKAADGTGGGVICELLAEGRQVVLPPSIHPDTQQPYVANVDLLDVMDQIPLLSKEIETILRGALEEAGYNLSHHGFTKVLNYVSVGARDNEITAMAGLYANGVTRGERTLKQAIEELRAWHANFVDKVAGDDIPVDKAIERLIHFINRDLTGPKQRMLPKGWDEGLTDEERSGLGLAADDETEEWSFGTMKAFIKSEFDQHANNEEMRMAAINTVLDRIRRSPTMDVLQVEALLDFMAQASRLNLTKQVLKRRLKELEKGSIAGENQTEIARSVLEDFDGALRFHDSQFWSYTGSHWEQRDDDDLMRHIAQEYGHLPAARKANDIKGVLQVMAKLCKKDLKDVSITGVNFANGVLTDDLQLLQHNPAYGMTYTLPFRYIPDGSPEFKEPTRFFTFLRDVWGHNTDFEQKVMAIQEALCVTLFGTATTYARAILLYGLAHSGKSQLLNIATSLVPEDKVSTVSPDVWSDKFEPAHMANKLLNIGGELSENKMIDGQKFKLIVEGARMNGQYKGLQIFPFRPLCAHWFAGNYLPKSRDTSEGFNRRWLIFAFDKVVKATDKKVNIATQIIAEEREAIVAWAVQAYRRLKERNDFTLPPSHEKLVNEMAGENDSVRFFIQASGRVVIPGHHQYSDATVVGQKTSYLTSAKLIHTEYSSWCITSEGARAVGYRKFCQRMRELGAVLGFSQVMTNGDGNLEEFSFAGLILKDASGKVMSSSTKTSSETT